VESSCEFGIDPLGSINCWKTIKCPNNWGSLEEFSAPQSLSKITGG
jgi:hypothetical protein